VLLSLKSKLLMLRNAHKNEYKCIKIILHEVYLSIILIFSTFMFIISWKYTMVIEIITPVGLHFDYCILSPLWHKMRTKLIEIYYNCIASILIELYIISNVIYAHDIMKINKINWKKIPFGLNYDLYKFNPSWHEMHAKWIKMY
jgi:hypothetical protein